MKFVLLLSALLISSSAFAYDKVYLKRLLEENQCHHCNLQEAPLADKDLSGADMSESQLQKIDLRKSRLKGVWFTHSRMHNANLEGADVSEALMDYAHLIDANLRDTNLEGTQFIFTDLSGADLTGSSFDKALTRGVIYCNTTMPDGEVRNDGCEEDSEMVETDG